MFTLKTKRNTQSTVRLAQELKDEYEALAARDGRTFNQIVELALKLAKPQIAKRIEMLESVGFQMPAVA